MGIARYRDAKTGELISDLSKHKGEYVVERPWGSDWGGDPIWPDEAPVTITVDQETAKELLKTVKGKKNLKGIENFLEAQIWKYKREDYI